MEQLNLPFDEPFSATDTPEMWTPRDVWVRFTQRMVPYFKEDRRIDYKATPRIDWDAAAAYFSAFSNSPDGGVLCYGVDNSGNVIGCKNLSQDHLNRLEKLHLQKCPLARPEFRRVQVTANDKQDFLILVYLPYVGKLVETNKSEAWIRYGDAKHKMSDEEKRDFRSSRNELPFELDPAPYSFPQDFDMRIVQDFCDEFRTRELRNDWSNEEVLVDKFLAKKSADGSILPLNSLVLLAAKAPGKTIPGCRVRVQRFAGTEEGSGESYSPLRDRTIDGNVVNIIKNASSLIEDFLYTVTWLNNDGKFVTTPEYPKWAWFEALVNACVHRSYSFSGTDIFVKIFKDRLEVESPGGFVPPVTEQSIYYTRAARNAHLMEALRYLGYVRMAREGTRRIRESMKEYGLPDPEFRQEALHGVVVRVSLHNDSEMRKRATDREVASHFGVEVWKALQEHEISIAAYAFRNGTIQVSEAQRLTGRTWATSKKDLDRLCRKKVLKFVHGKYQRDPKAHYILYREPADEREHKEPHGGDDGGDR